MATCYHDEQDFDSDLKIEVAREDELLKEDQELKEIECTKNPGHRGFIPFKDLKLEHLPEDERCMEMFDNVTKIGNRVVRLVVDKIKDGEHIKTAGTGLAMKRSNGYHIETNYHVVGTEEDVKHCSVEFFYESNNRSNIFLSQGTELLWTCPFTDVSQFKFEPVPEYLTQLDLIDIGMLHPEIVIYKGNHTESSFTSVHHTLLSFIHYTDINLNDPEIDIMFLSFCNESTSYLTSSYFQFQPIPSNIQDIAANIEIHVDEDDGNSTVISGDVDKFDDEYVVEISESILQDKVKKCRLVWNGEIVSRGTRLFFPPVKSSEFIKNRIDIEIVMEVYPDYFWLFNFHPKPSDVERCHVIREKVKPGENMFCIGHPHGGVKIVTFGRYLGRSTERFDIHGRLIVNPGEDCQCKEVNCVKYSCKTCPGSSGSPVFTLTLVLSAPGCHSHFMGYKVRKTLPNNEYVENLNMASIGPILRLD